jgi:uncharacterized protein (UPF0303 family)
MTNDTEELIRRLQAEEDRLVLDRFSGTDAWRLGRSITELALAQGHPVVIDIRRSDLILFRAALDGSTPDQQVWAERKAAVVLRMERSSALVAARLAGTDPVASGWLDHRYALTGGAVPIRVRGVGVVAAVAVSGLASEDDHALAVRGLETLLGGASGPRD